MTEQQIGNGTKLPVYQLPEFGADKVSGRSVGNKVPKARHTLAQHGGTAGVLGKLLIVS